jgi:hypothetical protein
MVDVRIPERLTESESSMNSVQIGQKSYEMPPLDGFTVADIDRSARFYETVFGGRITQARLYEYPRCGYSSVL